MGLFQNVWGDEAFPCFLEEHPNLKGAALEVCFPAPVSLGAVHEWHLLCHPCQSKALGDLFIYIYNRHYIYNRYIQWIAQAIYCSMSYRSV